MNELQVLGTVHVLNPPADAKVEISADGRHASVHASTDRQGAHVYLSGHTDELVAVLRAWADRIEAKRAE